jgi:Uma2 family endonuclease
VINAPGADLYLAPRTALADPYINAGDVSLVIEVSLSTFQRDRGAKAAAYAAGKIGSYWVVHRDRSIHVHRLNPNGEYEVAQVVRPGTAVQVLGPEALDFTFDPATLGH